MGGVYRRPPMDADARPATTLASAWPLFALRIRSERLVLRQPTDDEILTLIDVARDGIHPPDEMPFGVAWSVLPSPEFERSSVQHHWLMRATWTPDDWSLNLMAELDGEPIGAQSIRGRSFAVHRTVDTGSWLARAWQGQGLGKEMRSAVLAFAFDGLGARVATSEAFLDNVASNRVSRSVGYEDDGRGALAPQGVSRETQRFRMTVEAWRSRPRPAIEIEGLEACREMFGG
jgi:RimJ/RimL family protein N-acetyltransferase